MYKIEKEVRRTWYGISVQLLYVTALVSSLLCNALLITELVYTRDEMQNAAGQLRLMRKQYQSLKIKLLTQWQDLYVKSERSDAGGQKDREVTR